MEIFTKEFKESVVSFFRSKSTLKWGGGIIAISIIVIVFMLCFPFDVKRGDAFGNGINVGDTTIMEYGIPISMYDVKVEKVRNGEFFSTILSRNGISQKTIYDISQKSKGVFDLRQIRVGHEYHLYLTNPSDSLQNPNLDYMVYEKDAHSFVVFGFKDSLSVAIHEKEIETTLKYVEVTINNSLWMDLKNAGVTPLLALTLSDIYAWSIDFFGLQKGDSFKALYEEMSYKGNIMDIGDVKYALFRHAGSDYEAYHYILDDQGNEYWNEKGESMRKAFLKAPLNYKRISSGFTYSRRHPVTRKVQPHTGIDYAAPTGTPVVSIGDGEVIECRYKGAGGNTVRIKHNSVYTSAYLHLSKFGKGISVGKRVKQGQVIGYVGSTGRSTGPHLDFRIWKNGTPVNPLTMKMPPALPIPKDKMKEFEGAKEDAQRAINHFSAMQFFQKTVDILTNE